MLAVRKHMRCAGVALFAAVFFLSGCATKPSTSVQPQSEEAYRASLAEADDVADRGETEAAVMAYRKVATDNPSRDEPWVRIGQLRFAKGDYSLAIVAAEEALKRDPTNRQAKSIHAVGGLRLAMLSLEDLRKEGPLTGDAVTDAQRLASVLREALGQKSLIAVEPVEASPSRSATAPRRPRPRPVAHAEAHPSAGARPSTGATAPAPAPRSTAPSGGNPLDAFR